MCNFDSLINYLYEYDNLSASEKKRLLFEAGVVWDDYQYDSISEEDRFIYANEYYREWRGMLCANSKKDNRKTRYTK